MTAIQWNGGVKFTLTIRSFIRSYLPCPKYIQAVLNTCSNTPKTCENGYFQDCFVIKCHYLAIFRPCAGRIFREGILTGTLLLHSSVLNWQSRTLLFTPFLCFTPAAHLDKFTYMVKNTLTFSVLNRKYALLFGYFPNINAILNFCATKFLLNLTSPAVHLDKTDI